MRARERSRRIRAAVLALAAAGGTAAALGGCGRSGPLHLPKEPSSAVPAAGPATAAVVAPPAAPSLRSRSIPVTPASAGFLLRG